jgi:AraC family transcriptional regulator
MQRFNYGRQFAHALNVGKAPTLLTRPLLRTSEIAITEIRRDSPEHGYTSEIPREDSFLLSLNVREWTRRVLWIDGKPAHTVPLEAGTTNIHDLRREYHGYGVSAYHMISFYLPRAVLDGIADMEGVPRIEGFSHDPCGGIDDVVIRELGFSILPAFRRPDDTNMLFVDHVTTAIATHALHTYGTGSRKPAYRSLQLERWQDSRVKEIIAADLGGKISVAQLAQAIGLTLSEFRTAFVATIGMQPHHWLLERRIEKAMRLMRQTTIRLDAIATQCGFRSERHFGRVFGSIVGDTPQNWRRTILS